MEILNLGDFMRKKIKEYICYFLIISSIMILAGCSTNNEELLVSKLTSEMEYFDTTISNMLNKANGLTFEKYQVSAEKIEKKTDEESSSEGSGGGSSSGKESDSTSGEENGSSQEGEENQNNYQYKMVENGVLLQEKTPNWDELTTDIELIYSDWAVVTLDLYKKNIDNQMILSFNTDLDNAAKAIKDKNKDQTLVALAKLYSYIPTYFTGFSDNQMQINLYKAKANIFNAYAIIEQNKNEEVKKQLQLAEEAMIAMMNNMETKNQKEYNLNKAYILLKDLQNTVDKNDTDIFYLKYKNLGEELNAL